MVEKIYYYKSIYGTCFTFLITQYTCICDAGSVCGQAIADHKDVRKLGFTGSTEIGQVIMKSCAVSNLKKVSLELGGKSPFIIFADCDLDKAVRMVSILIKLMKMISEIL